MNNPKKIKDLNGKKCVVCGDSSGDLWGSENGFSAVRCSNCGLVYLDPWPDLSCRDKAIEYGMHEGEAVLNTRARYSPRQIKYYKRILGEIYDRRELSTGGIAWLDVGCGYGEFLETLSLFLPRDSIIKGSEPNRSKQQSAQERGLDVRFFDLEELDESFTHISILNVFSHLPDPVSFLASAKCLLRPGGEVVLQTANGADVARADYPGKLNFPDHLLFGGRRSLQLAFEKAGFEIVSWNEYVKPSRSVINIGKDLAKRVIERDYNPVNWGGPFRDFWIRARI